MLPIRTVFVLPLLIAIAACVNTPHSRSVTESSLPVTLTGVAAGGGEIVTLQAVDQNTGNLVPLGTAKTAKTGTTFTTSGGTTYTAFPWTFDAGVPAPNLWSPQTVVADLATAQGHLEIFASTGIQPFKTFSAEAGAAAMTSGLDPVAAGAQFADGTSTVLFDQTGVTFGAETPWVSVQGMVSNPGVPGYSSVAWSVGHYTVEGGKTIYGLICTPTGGGPHPVVIYNHGGTDGTNGGNLNGTVTAAGWTAQPGNGPDSLGQCLDWAKRGWIFATSAYRGENVNISSTSPAFPAFNATSGGAVEFCLGEVTDVLALTDLLAHHAGSISVGSAAQKVTLNVSGKILMYGYSHGGCITYRAVEQGAPVTAFSVIEGFSDMRLAYLTGRNAGLTPMQAAVGSGAFQPGVSFYLPDAAGVMGYNWRSAHYFASRGDLAIARFKTMPILILQGDIDASNPVPLAQAAEIAADIRAKNIFVGPNGFTPAASQPCIAGTVGAPLPSALAAPNAACPVAYTKMNSGDACVSGASPPALMATCQAVPLAPQAGQPPHFLVVYHNMNHTNGGLAIKNTFNGFVEQTFPSQPGCDGLQLNCATD